jgi:putative ABC transport system substrate-binding protein
MIGLAAVHEPAYGTKVTSRTRRPNVSDTGSGRRSVKGDAIDPSATSVAAFECASSLSCCDAKGSGGAMRRREFITAIGVTAASALTAQAQQPRIPLVGFLSVGSANTSALLVASFRQGLQETGYIEGQNITIEFRWADGQYDQLPALASDLVRRQAAVIVTAGGEGSAFAAKAASSTIPIVFNVGRNPVGLGLVASLGHPGGRITGINLFSAELAAKRLGLLHDLMPTTSVIAHLVNPKFPTTEDNIREVEKAAGAIGLQIVLVKASSESEIDAAFATILQNGARALLVGADPFFRGQSEHIAALSVRYAIPAIYEFRDFVEAGGLISYGTSLTEAYRQEGVYAGRILKGEKPSELPVLQLTKFELVINLKTAKTLGLAIPSGVLAIADDVID